MHKVVCLYSCPHDKEVESRSFANDPTIVSRDHENELGCSNNGPLNKQIGKFDCNDGNKLEEKRVGINIFEAAELFVHTRLESSKQFVEKVYKYLQHSSMTADDYKEHLQTKEMCETVVEEHTQEKLKALDLYKSDNFAHISQRKGQRAHFLFGDQAKDLGEPAESGARLLNGIESNSTLNDMFW